MGRSFQISPGTSVGDCQDLMASTCQSFVSLFHAKHKPGLWLFLSSFYKLKGLYKSKMPVEETKLPTSWPEEADNKDSMSPHGKYKTHIKSGCWKVNKISTENRLSLTNTFSGCCAHISLMCFYPGVNPARSCVLIPAADQSCLFLRRKSYKPPSLYTHPSGKQNKKRYTWQTLPAHGAH